jgi:DNA repair exonuclease SbcCD ATPase subunit
MKNAGLIFFMLMFCYSLTIAQVSEEERSMSQGMYNAFVINIPNADDGDAERLWRKFIKTKKAKTKKVKRTSEWYSEGVEITGLVAEEVDLYATFENSGDDVRMVVWFNMGEDYLSSTAYPSEYSAGEQVLYDFEMIMYKESVKEEIKEEENNLKKLESELKRAIKDKERYEREIEQAKDKIKKAEANIESSLAEQEEINNRIEEQLKIVERTKKKMESRDN